MKSTLTIDVKEPCKENFTNFSKTEKGGFCQSCEKEVIDFTNFSDTELVNYLSNSKKKTCGMFKASQLKSYETHTLQTMNNSMFHKGIAMMSFSLLALCATEVKGQETASIEPTIELVSSLEGVVGKVQIVQEKHTVTGTIVDEANEPLPGVNVVLKGTTIGTQTDFDGKFEFPQQLVQNDILVLSFIGYETKTYKVAANGSSNIDINITFDEYDMVLMGDIVIDGTYSSKRNIFQKIGDIFK
ncbi:carboxypeptidase-like regulatory domain-containing protein [Maribacter sp. 1_MG-2023]|uniref:carboxypeptidase-like regulatory domain-containing protein n=1 Tax=Maribacter sp. 1_MG-2023 TaxID=3062677 RepID=UPI0026E414DF|nr:carboxypeptidase-like regulatory domain-containing protein [Maribacter sp. 1_MG-2023]MDO6471326.1 carboxypeptidase-like regulatory domain-containing protein [Maribacter sp. 1_MG-2023]